METIFGRNINLSETITIDYVNEVYCQITSDNLGIESELSDYFTYEYPGARFTPRYKARLWDGKVKLYDAIRKTLYKGLIPYVYTFANTRNYIIRDNIGKNKNNISIEKIDSFIKSLNLYGKGNPIQVRDYQINAVHHALDNKRCVLLSPTGSGKSLMIYSICRNLLDQNLKTIVIVPTTSLVEQMYSDFEDYSSHNGWSVSDNCQKLYSGFPKEFQSNILFTTWQSAYTLSKLWFDQFDVVIGDEAHLFKANSLQKIMQRMDKIEYKIGTTGSLDDKKLNRLVLEGLFGPVHLVTTTNTLQKQGSLSDLKIKALVLNYPEETRKFCKGITYQQEIEFIVLHTKRNSFISNLALNTKGTTLVLFQFVEKHGKVLYELIQAKNPNRPVFFIHGNVDVLERENIRSKVAELNDPIIVASFGVYSTGINIPSIENIIFSSPSKSKIRNLQSIGRGLRLNKDKSHCTLYDITDNLSWKNSKNHTLKHGLERYKLYTEEQFSMDIIEVQM
jgi:superfamily II DNA or RNA helicase